MFSEERLAKIVEILKDKSSIKVNELAEFFEVSESTIRRDLRLMEENGLLSRTHGGAVSISNKGFEPTYFQKRDEKQDEKSRIGKLAASIIKNGDTIVLDSGTTTMKIAENITARDITVVTNSIDIASLLSEKESVELIVTGGKVRPITRAMVGHVTEQMLRNFRVDKAFIGTNGISITEGITTPNYIEAQTKKAMADIAAEVYVVADSSKFENVCFSVVCPVNKITAIITSDETDSDIINDYEKSGIEMITK